MIVSTLRLRNFRNYESLNITLDPKMNWITGDNAQGKTNLLESLVVLSIMRSFRIADDRKLIRSGCDFADLACRVQAEREILLRAVIHPGGKTLFRDRQPVMKTSEFIGILNTVLFSPDDLGIFLDAPAARRKLLDQEITKVSSGYLFALRKYRSLLKDRNTLLRQASVDRSYLEVLEERMRAESALIIKERREFITSLNERIKDLYRKLSGEDRLLSLQYLCCIRDRKEEEGLQALYESTREKDMELRMTTSGIHREDIVFTLDGENVIYTASQGQKRMIMLAMKLAFIPYIEEKRGSRAVLLLDDVLSELDEERQRRLVGLIRNTGQCVITGTQMPDFLRSEAPKEFTVSQGKMIGGIE